MKFFETSKFYSLKKSTYVSLRWIGIIGQLISVYFIYFYFNFEFNFIYSNIFIFLGILSNIYLIFYYKKTQLSERSALIFLTIDIFQLGGLIYLTGGIVNPFVIFLIIPSVFSSSNLGIKVNTLLVIITIFMIIFLTFFSEELPSPLNEHFHVSTYYYYAIPISISIALVFLNYFAIIFGIESRIRKEALNKMEEVMAKEHEMLSLGGQAAAAAHSLGTPLSTIKIISQELMNQIDSNNEIRQDIVLLSSQVERCNQILKRLSLNPIEEDEFIDEPISIREYLNEIIMTFKETSKNEFIFNFQKDLNSKKVTKSIEVVYGLRNFIGNANKFCKKKIFVNLKSDKNFTEVVIEDDGMGFTNDILSKIGEPYLKSEKNYIKEKAGLGLGIFIGKTLLEKNFAKINFENSKKSGSAKIIIMWKNIDLEKI